MKLPPFKKYGQWTPIGIYQQGSRVQILCECDCGRIRPVSPYALMAGLSTHCNGTGHGHNKFGRHGHARSTGTSRTYKTWLSMRQRCEDTRVHGYKYYGGRGITVCDRWKYSFDNFLEDMGPRPDGMNLDRYPNNKGNYEPGNCRWATPQQQAANRRKKP